MENGQDHIQKCLCSWWTEAQWWEVVRTTAGTSSSGSGSRDVLFPLLLHLELSVGGEVFCCQVLKLKSPLTNALAIRALLALLARYLFSLSLISTVTCVITNSLCDILYYCCITWVKCIACITCITGITWRQRAEWHIAVLYFFVSSVRSSNSHPGLLLTHHQHPLFQTTLVLNTGLSLSEPLSYIKAIMLYKGNHWTQCAGFRDASWVRLGITNDDLGTS